MQKELFIKVFGRVQGVFFRQNCYEKAEAMGIFGYVRNLPDRSVEVLGQGEEADLQKFLRFIESGPGYSSVERVEKTWRETSKKYNHFSMY